MVFPVTGHGYLLFCLLARSVAIMKTQDDTTGKGPKKKKEEAERILIQAGTFFFSFFSFNFGKRRSIAVRHLVNVKNQEYSKLLLAC